MPAEVSAPMGILQTLPPPGRRARRRSLRRARVLVVGLGAIGSVAADLLARGGIGFLRVVDRDVVEESNLGRQALYRKEDVGLPKAVAAGDRLRTQDEEMRLEIHIRDLHARLVNRLLEDVDAVVDGTDNLATRYLLNEACLDRGIPFFYGAARGSEGLMSPLFPPYTPCFRCLWPPPPDPLRLQRCQVEGVSRAASSHVGSLLVSQALRFLLSGEIAPGLYVVRAEDPQAERLEILPRPGCVACQGGTREFLAPAARRSILQLCGEDAVSLDPGRDDEIPLEALAARLARVARVRLTPYLLAVDAPPHSLSVFPDGRAIIRGVLSPEAASALYDRFVGL